MVLGALLVLAVAAPVVARVVQPEVRAVRGTPAEATASPASTTAQAAAPRRLRPALSPDRALRLARAEAIAAREARRERREARRAREAREARQARLRERAEERARKQAEARAEARERAAASAPFTVRIGSFNVLGSQHTGPGGTRQKFPPASVRTPRAAALAARHGVDILGTQELQADQLRGLQSRTGMAAYPGFGWGEAETDNSILWDPGVFEMVSGSRFTIPFMGRPRPQPIVRLRHLGTGREFYVVNTHPSAGGGRYLAERRNGQGTLVGIVNSLKSQGVPVLVTGDMNDRQEFYCRVVPATGMSAPNGGSYGSGCRPPPQPLPVDWVVGSGVGWSRYWRDTTPVNQRISDHFFISATAHLD